VSHGPSNVERDPRAPVDVVIIGGGIAGLTAAYYLAQAKRDDRPAFRVHIVEGESETGGQARAFKTRGNKGSTFIVEHGSHVFFNYYDTIIRLIDELRSDPKLAPTIPAFSPVPGWTIVNDKGDRATLQHSWWIPGPAGALPSILKIGWLSLGERIRVALGSARILLKTYEECKAEDDKVAHDVGIESGYSEAGVRAWNSASLGLTNLFIEEQSGGIFCGKHKLLIGTPDGLAYQLPAGDLTQLFAAPMTRKLDGLGATFTLGANVTKIERRSGDEKTTVTMTVDGQTRTLQAEHVILAVKPGDAKALLPWVDAPWTTLEKVTPVLTVVLRLDGQIADSADQRELGLSRHDWSFSVTTDLSRFWPDYAGDKSVIRVEIGHANLLPDGADIDERELIPMIKKDLDTLFPEAAKMKVEEYAIHRETKHLYTKWTKGEWSKQPTRRSVGHGVFLAGDWTTKGTIGMEAAANSGVEAANHVLTHHKLRPAYYRDVPI
jgi:protoporphyrinogen oxidase